jgi:hypothetical protein
MTISSHHIRSLVAPVALATVLATLAAPLAAASAATPLLYPAYQRVRPTDNAMMSYGVTPHRHTAYHGVQPDFRPQPGPPGIGQASSDPLPAGLRAALARVGLGAARGARLRPFAIRPSCACGGGGGSNPWAQQAELANPNGVNGDDFGWSVALSSNGSIALVGAPYQNNGTGAAYIFVRNGSSWWELEKLAASDAAAGDYFGLSVAQSGDGNTMLIGAWNKNNGTGAAYVFVAAGYFGWGQQAELTASNGASRDEFGTSVALSSDGSTALIGAPYAHYYNGPGAGAAYAFVRSGSTWSQQTTLFASDGAHGDSFGASVTLNSNGTSALIGAPTKGYSGAAYTFVRNGTWSQQAKLTPSNGGYGDGFGASVALSSNPTVALIGAPNANNYTGAAYVFIPFIGWNQEAELTPSDGANSGGHFGTSVALSSNGATALIGAPYAGNGVTSHTGAAYVFQGSWSTWTQAAKLTASDSAFYDQFGGSVAISGDGSTPLIGAPGHNYNIGAAYIF